jgi:hypothetical protein
MKYHYIIIIIYCMCLYKSGIYILDKADNITLGWNGPESQGKIIC